MIWVEPEMLVEPVILISFEALKNVSPSYQSVSAPLPSLPVILS